MYVSLVLVIILFVCVAMLVREGLWSNGLTLVNVLLAGLVATTQWESLANWLDEQMPSGTYLWDFVSLWMIFCLSFLITRVLTDLISRVRIRFKLPLDWAGGILLALLVGWVMVCFTSMTLHTAPLAEHFMAGQFYDTPDDRIFLGMFAPDREWLGWVGSVSAGTFRVEGNGEPFPTAEEFIARYAERRKEYEQIKTLLTE
ncbi:MAG: CvpA family protein [Pirellulales bacterium]